MKGNKLLSTITIIGIVALVFLVAACAAPAAPPAKKPPVKKPRIIIHNIIDLTGAYAPIAIPSEKGGKDYLAWIADQGGLDVDGDGKGDVEVEYHWAEFGNVDARFMAAYKRFRMEKPKPTIIEMWSSPNQEMLKPVLEKDKIVCYGIGFSDPQVFPPAWNYMDCATYGEQAVGAIEYYMDHMWGNPPFPPKHPGPLRVAHLTWDTAYGRGPIGPTKMWAEMTGKIEVVAERFCTFLPTDPEIMGFLKEFDEMGVDLIWSNTIVQTPAVIMKALHKMGLKKKMVLGANLWAPPDQLLDIVGPEAAETYFTPQPVYVPAAQPDEPGVKFARMLVEKYRPGEAATLPNIQYMRGIRMKANILESVRRALLHIMERDGVDLATACERITGKDVKEHGIQTLAGYDAHGTTCALQMAPRGKDDRCLTSHQQQVAIIGGKVQVVSPWYKVARLIPPEMLEKGYFKDEEEAGLINRHIIVPE